MGFIADIFGIDDGGASQYQKQALAEFDKLQIPDIESQKVELEKMVSQGKITPEQAKTYLQQKSEMQDISINPQYETTQNTTLNKLEDIANEGGLTAIDKAKIAQIQDQIAQQERGSREAILQNAQERGIGGSGLSLASQLANQQASATRASQQGTDVAAQAQARALEALLQGGNMATNLRTQGFNEEAEKAKAQDAINRFNIQQQAGTNLANVNALNQAQYQNLAEKQRISDVNTGLTNQQNLQNKALIQQKYQNELAKAQGKGGAYSNLSNIAQQQKNQEIGMLGNLIGAGAAIGSAAMKTASPAAVAAPAATGGIVGGIADVDGDSLRNDKVKALLSPGEIVIPRSIAKNPKKSKEFVEDANEGKTPIIHQDDVESMLSAMGNIRAKMCHGGKVQ